MISRTLASVNPSMISESAIDFLSKCLTDSLALGKKNQVLNHEAALLERPRFAGESAGRSSKEAKEGKE